jgi:hypothetical protein
MTVGGERCDILPVGIEPTVALRKSEMSLDSVLGYEEYQLVVFAFVRRIECRVGFLFASGELAW